MFGSLIDRAHQKEGPYLLPGLCVGAPVVAAGSSGIHFISLRLCGQAMRSQSLARPASG